MKKEVKVTFIVLCVMGAFMFHSVALAGEAYFTYPGTRAMGMAGAFTAQADNSSAVWYNPAGLGQQGMPDSDATVEYGSVPNISDKGDYNTDKSALKFISIGGHNKSSASFGLSYFVPYQFALYIPETGTFSSQPIGRVDATYSQYSFAGAIGAENLSLGATLDMVLRDVTGGSYSGGSGSGYGYSVGGLYKVVNSEYAALKAGAVYRSTVTIESNLISGDIVGKYLPSKPESTAYGLNLMLPFSYAIVNVNAVSEKILWSKVYDSKVWNANGADETKNMFGIEVMVPIYSTMVAVRAGQSTSTPDDTKIYLTTKSSTYGLGISINNNLVIDYASEERTLDWSSGDKKYNLSSVSATYQF